MKKHYSKMGSNSLILNYLAKKSNAQENSFHVSGFATIKAFLLLFVAFVMGSSVQGQVALYRIQQSNLVDCPNSCGTGSFYNDCGATNPGFFWNDTLPVGAIVDSIVVRFNLGVECLAGTRPTILNGVSSTQNVTTNNWCNCAQQEYLLIARPNRVDYRPLQRNDFKLTSGGSCVGFSQSFTNLNGDYAQVQVYYKRADLAVLDVKPVTNFTSMCKLSSYEVDVTIRNNGPGTAGPVDIRIEMPGAESFTEKVNVSDLGIGQTKTYRLSSEYLIPGTLGTGLGLRATILTADLDMSNNTIVKNWDVLSTPFGAEFVPVAGFPGFPRDGNRFAQDYITYNKSYRYNITAPSAYSNANFGTAWTASFSALLAGAPMPSSKFTYTPPQGGNNAFVQFQLDESDLNKEVQFRFAVTDISGNGCDSTTIRYAVVMPTPKPSFDGFSVCEIDELQFVNKSTIASGLNSYRWDFGDNVGKSTLFEPKYKYGTVGTYPVKLVAVSNIGFADSITVNVAVNPSPVVDFNFANQCGNNLMPFTNASSISGGTLSYFWEFGDGQTSTQANPSIIYANPGPYNVKLTVESDKGCTNVAEKATYSYPAPKANFTLPASICGGDNVTLQNATQIPFSTWGSEWRIGSSERRTLVNSPTHRFTQFGLQPVTLKVTTQFGCVDSITKMVEVKPGPAIDITTSDVCSSGPVIFNSNISVPEGMSVDYVWNIAGTLYASPRPSVSFNASGTKNVSVDITYANGCRNNASTQVLTGYRPDADFSVADVVCAGEAISLSNNTTIEFNNAQHTWFMGDGSTYTGVLVPNHVYTNTTPQTYTITLVSSSPGGICPDTASKQVTVGVIPTCDFDIVPTYVPGHRGYTFAPTQTEGKFTWYFGDGRISRERSPIYQYNRDGNFGVRLVVETNEGCTCEKSANNLVVNLSSNTLMVSNGISVYPNPSNGVVYVANQGVLEIASIRVMNTVGASIADLTPAAQMNEYTLDLSGVANGVYMVTIQTKDGNQFVQKVVLAN